MLRTFLFISLSTSTLFANYTKEADEAYNIGDLNTAVKLYKKSARLGDDDASFKLGKLYYKGKGVKRDVRLALKYFENASLYGHEKARYNIATIYSQKKFNFHNYKKAYQIFEELAKKGNAKAQNKVGIFLTYGLGVPKDYKMAVEWFNESYYKNGYIEASCSLALMYASGKGVFPNFGRAREISQEGFNKKIPSCVKVYNDFNLHKYSKDKGFKYGFYK